MEPFMDEIKRAYATWRKWHNPMSRRWYRAALAEWRRYGDEPLAVDDFIARRS